MKRLKIKKSPEIIYLFFPEPTDESGWWWYVIGGAGIGIGALLLVLAYFGKI
ncbi:MAG: hypothetical protein V2B19_17470 [Pseudomonadota bacterium]